MCGITGCGVRLGLVVLCADLGLAVMACENSSLAPGEACCDAGAPPIFLSSKLDDDDGDGNPRDENVPDINDEDDDIADHAWMRDDAGTFHLFFHTEANLGPSVIEHYTSRDLRSLQYVGTALAPLPGTWDQDGLWAPFVIRENGTYFMFYTGVSGVDANRVERIGLASSDDLMQWTRLPGTTYPGVVGDGCVYECNESWTAWSVAPGDNNQQCRDPFVIRDPATAQWLLFVTAKSTNGFETVAVAASDDLVHWNGAGYIDATRRLPGGVGAQATGGMAENPFVVARPEANYLFFTDWRDPEDSVSVAAPRTAVQYVTSPSLSADSLGSANWTYRGYTPDPGVNAVEVQRVQCGSGEPLWILSHSIARSESGVAQEHRRDLRLKCILWNGDLTFDTMNPAFHLRGAVGSPTAPNVH